MVAVFFARMKSVCWLHEKYQTPSVRSGCFAREVGLMDAWLAATDPELHHHLPGTRYMSSTGGIRPQSDSRSFPEYMIAYSWSFSHQNLSRNSKNTALEWLEFP